MDFRLANYHTLANIQRGHGLAEYIDSVLRFFIAILLKVCTHLILNLPGYNQDVIETAKIVSVLGSDIVKLHSLYIARNTVLSKAYENGTIQICSKRIS